MLDLANQERHEVQWVKARGGSRFLSNILVQSNFNIKIIFELLTCPCKQFIKFAVHVCRIAEINSQIYVIKHVLCVMPIIAKSLFCEIKRE